ncbi:MAG: YraN family protein [Bacteroidales bacterium]|nr:YraN family protein [Bacteroidales bacterium]
MAGRNEIGRKGEDIVCQYLMTHGHAILDRNWRSGHLELDIVSLARDGIHFVEVKSRVAPVMAQPEENVRSAKKQRVARAAKHYLEQKNDDLLSTQEAWLDVASVIFSEDGAQVEYFPRAYVPIYFG